MQWYPGHMKAARKEIVKAISSNDVILEVLDARMPPRELEPDARRDCRGKPCLKLFCKTDLADPQVTSAWRRHLESGPDAPKVLELALLKPSSGETRTRVLDACRALAPNRDTRAKPVRGLVVGIPNVGKSTLINVLMERKVTRASDQPGVTTTTQLVTLREGVALTDNPGVLWPRIDEPSLLRLAVGGAIPESELDYVVAGLFFAELAAYSVSSARCRALRRRRRFDLAGRAARSHRSSSRARPRRQGRSAEGGKRTHPRVSVGEAGTDFAQRHRRTP